MWADVSRTDDGARGRRFVALFHVCYSPSRARAMTDASANVQIHPACGREGARLGH